MNKTILVVGTFDTKDDELNFVCDIIRAQGGTPMSMDVSVLGDPKQPTDISKHDVTAAIGKTIQDAIDAGDENFAMQIMAAGAATLTAKLYADRRIDGIMGWVEPWEPIWCLTAARPCRWAYRNTWFPPRHSRLSSRLIDWRQTFR